MRARQRHFNPISTGVERSWDARFNMDNFANGASVGTWTDRGNSTVTQASSSLQPIYNTNEINGNPAVVFTSNRLEGTYSNSTNNQMVLGVFTMNSSTSSFGRLVSLSIGAGNNDFSGLTTWPAILRDSNNQSLSMYRNSTTVGTASITYDVAICFIGYISGSSYILQINGTNSTFSSTSANFNILSITLGDHSARTGNYWNGKAGAIAVTSTNPSSSLQKRLIHCYAFSFKIACS